MIGWLSELAGRVMDATTYGNPEVLAALFFIAALIEVGVPFPLVIDTVLFVVGYQFAQVWFYAIAIVFLLFLGRECGAGAVYWIFRSAGGPLVKWIWQHIPFLQRQVEKASAKVGEKTALGVMLTRLGTRSWTTSVATLGDFGMHASYAVALSRITPGLLTLTSVVCGIFRVRYRYFSLGVGLTSVLVDGAEILLGVVLGYGLSRFGITKGPWLIGVGVLVNILMIWLVLRILWRYRRESEAGSTNHQTKPQSRQ